MAGPAKDQGGFAGVPAAGKLGILLGLVVGLVVLYYFALHQPLADEITAADTMNTRLLGEARAADQRARDYLELRTQLGARAPLDRQNKRILPARAEIPAFLQDLNRLAELSGLQMKLVEPRPEEAQERYVRIPVALELVGRYQQVEKFFYNVSRLDRAIAMENVHLVHPHLDGEDILLDVSVLATTYRQPTPEEAQTAAAAASPNGAAPGQPAAPSQPALRGGGGH